MKRGDEMKKESTAITFRMDTQLFNEWQKYLKKTCKNQSLLLRKLMAEEMKGE